MNTPIQLAKRALRQAEEMLSFAEHKQWNELELIQKQHEQTVAKLSKEIPQEALRDILLQIKELNAQTSALADQHRKQLITEQQTLKKAQKMQKALNAFK